MRWLGFGLVLVGVTGCSSELFALQGDYQAGRLACEAPFAPAEGELTWFLLNGEIDGTFDFDVDGEAVESVAGLYDYLTGDFEWEVTHHPEHRILAESVQGYGTVFANGDLDLVFERVVDDRLEGLTETQVRVVREGCEVSRTTRFVDDRGELRETVEDGAFNDAGSYVYDQITAWPGYDVEVSGTRAFTRSFTETMSFEYFDDIAEEVMASRTEERTGDLEAGSLELSFESYELIPATPGSRSTTYRMAGTESWDFRGTLTTDFSRDVNGQQTTWAFTRDREGNGDGSLEFNGGSCEVTWSEGVCEYDCGRGQIGTCPDF